MGTPSTRGRSRAATIALAAIAFIAMAVITPQSRADGTVTISGNAYAFIFAGNLDRLEGAKIGIAELPELTTTAGPNGAYALEVPDDTTITPYAVMPGYYTTHVQTFHTRGRDLNQVNFQMPAMPIYDLLAQVVGAERNPDGTLAQCGIVSTFFQKEGRSFLDFDDFHDFRPHGVEGSTATITPQAGTQLYFNESVIPDPAQQSSSRDGGVLWHGVPAGTYLVQGENPTTRHAPFVATCEPGRLVNANPPWGLYEMARTEEPNPAVLPADPDPLPDPVPADERIEAWVASARVAKRKGRPAIRVVVRADESVRVRIKARQGRRTAGRALTTEKPRTVAWLKPGKRLRPGRVALRVDLTDEAGNARSFDGRFELPARKRSARRGG